MESTSDTTTPFTSMPPPPTKKGHGCLFYCLGFLTAMFLPVMLLIIGCLAFHSCASKLTEEFTSIAETTSNATCLRGTKDAPHKVLRLELNGTITGEPESAWLSSPDKDVAVRTAIEKAITSDYDALLLVISSPGGSVTASDELYHALERFKAGGENRKVIVLAKDIIASGAYYCAMMSDWIRIQPTTLIGSIGVIVPGINAAGLAEKLGLSDNSIASGASKDLGNPLKPINPDHNAILATVVNSMYDRFVSLVAKGRHLSEQDVRNLADGRVFTPVDALNLKLIDDIGYEDTLDAVIANCLDCEEKDIAIYSFSETGLSSLKFLMQTVPASFSASMLEPLSTSLSRPLPQYRY